MSLAERINAEHGPVWGGDPGGPYQWACKCGHLMQPIGAMTEFGRHMVEVTEASTRHAIERDIDTATPWRRKSSAFCAGMDRARTIALRQEFS